MIEVVVSESSGVWTASCSLESGPLSASGEHDALALEGLRLLVCSAMSVGSDALRVVRDRADGSAWIVGS